MPRVSRGWSAPGFFAVGLFDFRAPRPMGDRRAGRYPIGVRRKVLDLVLAGRYVAEVAEQIGVSGQGITAGATWIWWTAR